VLAKGCRVVFPDSPNPPTVGEFIECDAFGVDFRFNTLGTVNFSNGGLQALVSDGICYIEKPTNAA
jgi:hypothetical protein